MVRISVSTNYRVQPPFAYKGFEGGLLSIQKIHCIPILDVTVPNMPAGHYKIAHAPILNDVDFWAYLTDNGEGKQLTIEDATGETNQEWYITPTSDEGTCTITPQAISPAGVSDDVPDHPEQVFLLRKLRRWVFNLLPGDQGLYEIVPFDDHRIGAEHLLGVDDKRNGVIIQNFSIFPPGSESVRPAWKLFLLR
ncbi:hypothetical protein BYT27DRAFT_6753663 [Phlegmacium glaucopus]|nr:hypothetical protein BYT27DRAFT_6753663 [Phlegmacium glaucopus]